MNEWIIYDHEFPNGKHYIGKTSNSPNVRWGLQGQHYKNQPLIWKAIQKYGWNNIKHNILFFNLNEEDANEKEQEMIAYYHSYYLDELGPGYNMTKGGEGNRQVDIKKIEELFLQGIRPAEIARQLNYFDDTVCSHLKNMGYKLAKSSSKKINQFDLEGNYITTYESLTEAENILRIDRRLISGCIRGKAKSTGIYQFKEYDEKDLNGISPVKRERGGCKSKKVACYDLNDNLVKIYDTITEAAKDVGRERSNIRMAAQGKYKTSAGYKWKYYEE